jgi:hypothetical protein
MRFEQPTIIEFNYQGEVVEYTIQQTEINGWLVSCNHPIFTERFHGGCFNNPLGEILNSVQFVESDYDFFTEMRNSFMTYPYED